MAIRIGVSPRTRGGAVYPRMNLIICKSIFSQYAAIAAFRKMMAAVPPAFPLIAAGSLCAIAVSIAVQPIESQQADAERGAAAIMRRVGSVTAVEPHERPNDQASGVDPAPMLARTFALGTWSEREPLVRELLCGWAARDGEAALNWVSSLEDPAARRSARATVCLSLAEEDPRHAVVLALIHGADEEDDSGLLESLTMQWCEKESEAVLDWALTQPPGEWKNRLVARASFVLSKLDPVRAAHLVSGLEPGSLQDEAAMAVLHQWALKDSSAAFEWAEAFSEPALRERALAEISNLRNLATSLQEVH